MIEILISAVLGAFVGVLAVYLVGSFAIFSRLQAVEERVSALQGKLYSGAGNEKRQQSQDRMIEAIAKVAALTKDGKPINEVLPQVAAEYPDVAMLLAKKGGIKF